MATSWIDVSVPIHTGMVHWPDNPPVRVERMLDMGAGDACNVSKLSLGVHTGTHIDAPIHFLPTGKGVDEALLGALIGPARVLEIADPESIKAAELEPYQLQPGERILFKTRNSPRCWQSDDFVEDFVYISQEAARYLADRRVQAVGVDYLSVGGFHKDGQETHHALLSAEIWIIEGLNLAAVRPGNYELICLPLRITGADGAPARVVLRTLEE
jgi:arylformamidase